MITSSRYDPDDFLDDETNSARSTPELSSRRTRSQHVRKRARRNRSNEIAKRGIHQRRNKRVAW